VKGVLAKINTYISGRVKGRRQRTIAGIQYLHPLILSSTLTYIANLGTGTLDLLESSWTHGVWNDQVSSSTLLLWYSYLPETPASGILKMQKFLPVRFALHLTAYHDVYEE